MVQCTHFICTNATLANIAPLFMYKRYQHQHCTFFICTPFWGQLFSCCLASLAAQFWVSTGSEQTKQHNPLSSGAKNAPFSRLFGLVRNNCTIFICTKCTNANIAPFYLYKMYQPLVGRVCANKMGALHHLFLYGGSTCVLVVCITCVLGTLSFFRTE